MGDVIYRTETLVRGEVLQEPGYRRMLEEMATLAREVGPRRVRIVVAFDS